MRSPTLSNDFHLSNHHSHVPVPRNAQGVLNFSLGPVISILWWSNKRIGAMLFEKEDNARALVRLCVCVCVCVFVCVCVCVW